MRGELYSFKTGIPGGLVPDLVTRLTPYQTPHWTSPDIVYPHRTSPDCTGPHQASPDLGSRNSPDTSPDFTGLHRTSSGLTGPHWTSLDLGIHLTSHRTPHRTLYSAISLKIQRHSATGQFVRRHRRYKIKIFTSFLK